MTRLRPSVKFWIKIAVSYSLYYTGLLQLWQSFAMRQKAVVLMYHRVLAGDEHRLTASHPAIVIDQDTFATHMAVLKQRFRVLSLAEFAACVEQRIPFPDRSCVITFDDGWRDNYANALPVLQRHGFPAVIFLPVNYIGRGRLFWPEALTHLLCRAIEDVRQQPGRRPAIEAILAGTKLGSILDLPDADPRPTIIEAVRAEHGAGRPALEALAAALASALNVDLDRVGEHTRDGFMDWAQIEAMARCGVSFGGHGADHHLLTQVPTETARAEIGESRRVLHARLHETVATFSYPNGYWTPAIRELVKEAGYRLAFITQRGFVSCTDDPFTVRRLNVHEAMTGSKPMFLARMVGLL